ncbi:hypothetical protein NBRC3299_1559 [Acetobacter pasteurianus NBRC 3299]|nr:hypothetical protein NBRC3299_1559 [Acetobacter pasteurianus NBRC 3299]
MAYGYNKVVPENLPTHLVSGKRVLDVNLIVENQSMTLYRLMEKGDWVHLTLSSVKHDQPDYPEWLRSDSVKQITGQIVGDSPSFSGVSGVLIRPDGYAHSVSMD